MLKKIVRSALCISFLATSAFVTNAEPVDYSLPVKREKVKIFLTYDAGVDEYFEKENSTSVAKLNQVMEKVNSIFAASNTSVEFDWQLIPSSSQFPFDADNYKAGIYNAISEQQWYKDSVLHNLSDFHIAVFSPDVIPQYGGSCIIGVGYDEDDYENFKWKNPNRTCWVSAYNIENGVVLAHEIAHYLGAKHNRYQLENYDNQQTFSNAIPYGYVSVEHSFITMMSYTGECNEANVSCEKIPLFSNPDILHKGVPIGKSEQSDDAANVAKMLGYGAVDLVKYDYLPTTMSIENTASQVTLSWPDIASSYVIKTNSRTGDNPQEYAVTEPKISLNRPFFGPGNYDWQGYKESGTVYAVYLNKDVERLIPISEFELRPRSEDLISTRDGQLGFDRTLVSLPAKGESFDIQISLMDSHAENSDLILLSEYAECIKERLTEYNNCINVNTGFSVSDNPDHYAGLDPIYGDTQPDWLQQFFDISISGSGSIRTLRFTSKMDVAEWREYLQFILDEYGTGQNERRDIFIQQQRLPLNLIRIDTFQSSTLISGSAALTVDLSSVFDNPPVIATALPNLQVKLLQKEKESVVLSKLNQEIQLDLSLSGQSLSAFDIAIESPLEFTLLSEGVFVAQIKDVESGVYTVDVSITAKSSSKKINSRSSIQQSSEKSTARNIVSSKSIIFTIVDELPVLSAEADTDNDGLLDIAEGFSDSDNDGFVDYLDPTTLSNQQALLSDGQVIDIRTAIYGNIGIDNTEFLVSERLKNVKQGLVNNLTMTLNELLTYYPTSTFPKESYTPFTDVLDVTVQSESLMNDVRVSFELPEGQLIPEDAVLLEFSTENGWIESSKGVNNLITMSAKKSDGQCPSKNDDTGFELGLNKGSECVYLWKEIDEKDAVSTMEFGLVVLAQKIEQQTNTSPEITVSNDLDVFEGETVTLTTSGTDLDSDALVYRWAQTSGTPVALSGVDTTVISFIAPNVTSDETLTFTAYASDNIVEVSKIVTVVVKNKTDAAPTVEPKKESSSGGGSFGWLLMLITGIRLFRK